MHAALVTLALVVGAKAHGCDCCERAHFKPQASVHRCPESRLRHPWEAGYGPEYLPHHVYDYHREFDYPWYPASRTAFHQLPMIGPADIQTELILPGESMLPDAEHRHDAPRSKPRPTSSVRIDRASRFTR
jgi:hypothetical protein